MDKLDIELFVFDQKKKVVNKDIKGSIYIALNLFTLSYFEEFFRAHINSIIFWCDGIMGKIHLSNRGIKTSKVPGPTFLKQILNKIKNDVIIIGNMDDIESKFLSSRNINVIFNHKLVNYKYKDLKLLNFHEDAEIIITLPSPLQEEAAFYLHQKFPNNNFFCVGGALKMVTYPELEAPKLIRNIGLEWLYRFKTDPIRRLKRISKSFFKYLKNFKQISKYKWRLLIE